MEGNPVCLAPSVSVIMILASLAMAARNAGVPIKRRGTDYTSKSFGKYSVRVRCMYSRIEGQSNRNLSKFI